MIGPRRLWIVCAGNGLRGRPERALLRPPRSGPRVPVTVPLGPTPPATIFVLFRTGAGNLVLAAALERAALEVVRARLGDAAAGYAIEELPVQERDAQP